MNEQLTLIYGYLHGMWRYRWSALTIAWLVALLGWSFIFTLPDQFSARTVVYVDTSSALKPLLKGLATETDTRDELQIMTRILLSRENLMEVARESDMDLEVNSIEEREELIDHLAKAVRINGGRGSKNKIYEISYKNSSANRSYQVVSNLLNTMIEGTLKTTRTDTVSAQKFLDSQIAIYEARLSEAEQKLALFKKENVGLMPDERGGYFIRLQRAEDSVKEITTTLNLAQRRFSELSRQLKGENQIIMGDHLTKNEKKIKQYQEQLDLLLNQFTERHPDVLALRAIIDDLKNAPVSGESPANSTPDSDELKEYNPIYQEVKVELSKASVEVETLKIKLKERQAYVEQLRQSIDIIPEVEANLAKLNRGYEVIRERYLNLVERREAAELAQSAGQSSSDITFRVIEPPMVPTKASGPKRALLLTGVLVAALGAGLAWSFLRFMLLPTFIDLVQLGTATGLPVLGSVSLYLSPEYRNKRRLQLTSFISATFLLIIVFGAVVLLREPFSVFFASVIEWNKI